MANFKPLPMPKKGRKSQTLMNKYNEPNWDQIRADKEDKIKWLNALNNACLLVANGKVEFKDLEAEANRLYQLGPKNASTGIKTAPTSIMAKGYRPDTMKAKPASPKQIDFIKKLAAERDIDVDFENLDSWQASKKIEELKKFPVKSTRQEADFTADLEAGEAIEYEQ